MTILAHTIVSATGVSILGLHGSDVYLAYLFGVAPDLDHALKAPLYYKKHKLKKVRHYNWRTPLQEPTALLWIGLLSIFINTWVPVVFFTSHLIMDYLMSYPKQPFYPFSRFTTRGFLVNIPDWLKEVIVTGVALVCLSISLA